MFVIAFLYNMEACHSNTGYTCMKENTGMKCCIHRGDMSISEAYLSPDNILTYRIALKVQSVIFSFR